MNLEIALKVVIQWKRFVLSQKELRQILMVQYKSTYVKLLYGYREYKKRKFQNYIETNAAKLIFKALHLGKIRIDFLKHFLINNFVKRIYFLHDDPISKQVQGQPTIIKAIRPPIFKKNNYKQMVPKLCSNINNSIIIFNFQALRILQKEQGVFQNEQITQPFLYFFKKLVSVKRSQQQFKLNKEQLLKYLKTLNAINKFQQKEYLQIKQIYNDVKLLKKIYLMNRVNHTINIFFDFQIKEICAAVKIQKVFRGYLNVKKKGLRYEKIMTLINESRSVYILQRWYRRMRFQHRCSFFKDIFFKCYVIQSNILYLEENIYVNLNKIKQDMSYRTRFIEQYSNIVYDDSVARLKLHIPNTEILGQTKYMSQIQDLRNLQKEIIPVWLSRTIQQVPLMEKILIKDKLIRQHKQRFWNQRNRSNLKFHHEQLKIISNYKIGDIFQLLHKGSDGSFEIINGRKYLKLKYESIVEARYRLLAVALLTYRFNNNGTYIELFGENHWDGGHVRDIEQYFSKIEKVFKIKCSEIQTNTKIQEIKPVVLVLNHDEDYQRITLKFYNEYGQISTDHYFKKYFNEKTLPTIPITVPPLKIIQAPPALQIQDSSRSTQVPAKYSIISFNSDKVKQKPQSKQRNHSPGKGQSSPGQSEKNIIEQILTSKYKYQDQSIQCMSPELKSRFLTEKKKESINNSFKQSTEARLQENRRRVASLKQEPKEDESFYKQFNIFTNLILRQEKKFFEQKMRQQPLSQDFRRTKVKKTKLKPLSSLILKSPQEEEQSPILPQIQKQKQKNRLQPKLSNIHRYAVFPEELYAVQDKDTLQY
ncbi:hypothetical protein pb186bvf_017258 [Paramecium bursaria]